LPPVKLKDLQSLICTAGLLKSEQISVPYKRQSMTCASNKTTHAKKNACVAENERLSKKGGKNRIVELLIAGLQLVRQGTFKLTIQKSFLCL